MNLLENKVHQNKSIKRKSLVFYLTPGYPNKEATLDCAKALSENGADIVEIGIPFSDPIADGPTIQNAGDYTLKRGMRTADVLRLVEKIKASTALPVIIMSYLNPLMAGSSAPLDNLKAGAARLKSAGVDGLIIPDIIPEEGDEIKPHFNRAGLSLVYMAAPNSDNNRLAYIDRKTDGFVYVVSLTGVTGRRKELSRDIMPYLKRTSRYISCPRYLGFGISSPDHIRKVKRYCDGVIVGSALLDLLGRAKTPLYRSAAKFSASLRNALDAK